MTDSHPRAVRATSLVKAVGHGVALVSFTALSGSLAVVPYRREFVR